MTYSEGSSYYGKKYNEEFRFEKEGKSFRSLLECVEKENGLFTG